MSEHHPTPFIIVCGDGSSFSLRALHDQYYFVLCHFAASFSIDVPAAEDIVTDVFVMLWRRRMEFGTGHHIRAFLYVSTRNACLNQVRRSQRDLQMKSGFSNYLSSDHEGYILNKIIEEERMQQIYAAIEDLPCQCKEVFKMSYVEGLSNTEIAARAQLSINTVKNHKVRALGLLRKHFEPATII